ncbi:MAG: hypothetical protein ACRBF0_00645 [Calditrichia bacterium]
MDDINGVRLVQKHFAKELLSRAYRQQESLVRYVADVKKGISSKDWVD